MTCLHIRRSLVVACLLAGTLAGAAETAGALPALDTQARWTVAAPAQTQLPARIVRALRPQDVLAYAAPGVLFPVRNIGLQCQGVNATLADLPQRSALAQTATGNTELRFGEAEIAGTPVFRLQAGAHDALAPGSASRCELVSYPMAESALPSGQTFWWALSFWADDWSGSHDEQLIAQFHVQEPRKLLLNPFFALVVRGSALRVELRHNPLDLPTQASTQLVTAARLAMPVRQWVTAVVQARMGNDAAQAPFLRLWLNGALVADYAGPLGYVLPAGGLAYAKAGIYHWLAGNDWDLAVPSRALLIGAMLGVRDATGRYTAEQLAAAVAPAERR